VRAGDLLKFVGLTLVLHWRALGDGGTPPRQPPGRRRYVPDACDLMLNACAPL